MWWAPVVPGGEPGGVDLVGFNVVALLKVGLQYGEAVGDGVGLIWKLSTVTQCNDEGVNGLAESD
jgi:hypothetical protein